jgi:SAM-dependent methyltransferase
MGLSTSPARFADFYRAAFARALADGGAARILVSGAADLDMLSQVDLACAATAVTAEIRVIDLCETPLALCRWYAERRGLRVATERSDVLSYAPAAPFDVVCSDSFLGQFPPPTRERLIARWASLLRPGGSVITVNRLRPDADPMRRVEFSAEQARAFVEAVRRGAAKIPPAARPPLEEISAEAARYARRQGAWPLRSAAELEALFARGGFEIARLEVAPIAGEAPGTTAPTVAGGAPYARIEARLRD